MLYSSEAFTDVQRRQVEEGKEKDVVLYHIVALSLRALQ